MSPLAAITGADLSEVVKPLADQLVKGDGVITTIDDLVRSIVWIILLLGVSQIVATSVRNHLRTSADRLWLVFLVSVFALALFLRLALPPWAPLHENEHGIADLRRLASAPEDWGRSGFAIRDAYGPAYGEITGLVVRSWHGGWKACFVLTALLSSLAVVPLAVLVATTLQSRAAAVVAAVALAFHSPHITLSLSENPLGVAGMLFLLSLALASTIPGLTSARDRAAAYWAGLAALAAGTEMSVLTLLFPLTVLLIAGPLLGRRLLSDLSVYAFPALLLIVSVALHILYLQPVLADATQGRSQYLSGAFLDTLLLRGGVTNALLNPTIVSTTFVPLAEAGLVVLFLRRRILFALGLVISFELMGGIAFVVSTCRQATIRYQPTPQLPLFVLLGALVVLVPVAYPKVRAAAALTILTALLCGSRPALASFHDPLFSASAFRLVSEAEPLLPARLTIHSAERHLPHTPIGDFPEFILQDRGHEVVVDEDPDSDNGDNCFVWVGPSCYSYGRIDKDDPVSAAVPVGDSYLRQQCLSLASRIDSSRPPLLARRLPSPFAETVFLRVVGRPPVGLFPCRAARERWKSGEPLFPPVP